jgi:ribosomal protein L11 methyltransferase
MSDAHFTLTLPSQTLENAQSLADAIDTDFRFDALAVMVNETDEENALWNTVAYFETEVAALTAKSILGGLVDVIPDVDWVRRSLEGLAPVTAGRFFLHGSHDRGKRRSGGCSIEIDAGTAFGTGHHGTTAGCLRILDRLLKARSYHRIFDLGCGTGVLAIAAAKAGKVGVLATDIDQEAVRVSLDNAVLNNLRPSVLGVRAAGLHHPAIQNAAPFDLIFANILARPLVALAQGISRLLAPGGTVILSGLTRDQLRWVGAAYKVRGLVPSHVVRIDNWVAVAMTKPFAKTKRPKQSFGRSAIYTKAPGWERDI